MSIDLMPGFGAFTPFISSGGLDGSESDGTQLLAGDAAFSSGWTLIGGGSVSTNAATSPAGTTTAARFTEGDAGRKTYLQTVTITDAVHTLSFYLKYESRRYAQIAAFNANGTSSAAMGYFDLQTGAVTDTDQAGSPQSVATSIATGANGFYKCSVQFRLHSTVTSIYPTVSMSNVATFAAPLDGDSPSYTSDGSTFLMWRPKLSLGSF